MDTQPTLASERLLLRPLRPGDRAALYAAVCDPLIWEQHPEPDRWREPAFAAHFATLLAQGGSLAVIDRRGGTVIGVTRYQYGSPDNGGTVEIGSTVLARSHWGGWANREAKRLMIAHALASVAQVEFWAGRDNARSRRALEKIGARLLDRIEPVEIDGRSVPHVVYAIARADFETGPLVDGET